MSRPLTPQRLAYAEARARILRQRMRAEEFLLLAIAAVAVPAVIGFLIACVLHAAGKL